MEGTTETGERRGPLSRPTRSEGQSCILGAPRGLPGWRALGFPGRKKSLELGNVRLGEVVTGLMSPSSCGGLQLRRSHPCPVPCPGLSSSLLLKSLIYSFRQQVLTAWLLCAPSSAGRCFTGKAPAPKDACAWRGRQQAPNREQFREAALAQCLVPSSCSINVC